jgi:hypothetical protein
MSPGPGGFGTVNNPASGGGGIVPQYPPAGVIIGTNILNSDFSTAPNGSFPFSSYPQWGYWFNNTGSMNGVQLEASNVAIVSGQLVLTLSDNSHGAALVTTEAGTGGNFTFGPYAYVEFDIIVPTSGWWATWLTNTTDDSNPYGEFDVIEQLGTGGSGLGLTTNYHGPGSASYNGGVIPDVPSASAHVVIGGLWQAGECRSYINGTLQKTIVNGDGSGIVVGSTPEGIILNIGTSGGSTPQTLKVNSVRVWDL